jgi:glycosyltransferase involved in cell wall biosynthesis
VEGSYVAVSQHVFDEIEDGGVELRGPKSILPNWVVGPYASLDGREWYEPGRAVRCAFTGTLHVWKGTDVAIEAIALLRRTTPDAVVILDVFGEDAAGYFTQMAGDLGVADVVRFHGFRPHAEVMRMYVDYDLFVFPTAPRDPFPLAPIEAGVAGCVPLITDDCGFAEWFVGDVHCLKAPRTAEGFAQALHRVFRGEVRLEPIGRRMAAVIRRDFDWEAVMPRHEAAIVAAAQRPRRPSADQATLQRLAVYGERLAERLVEEMATAG